PPSQSGDLPASRHPANGVDRVAFERHERDLTCRELRPARPRVGEGARAIDVLGELFAEVAHENVEAHGNADPGVAVAPEQVRLPAGGSCSMRRAAAIEESHSG